MENKIPSRHLELYNRKLYEELAASPDLPSLFYRRQELLLETSTIIIPMTLCDGSITSAHSFFNEVYRTRLNHQVPLYDDAVDYLCGFLIESFNQFCKGLEEKFKNSFDDILLWTQKWRDVSIDIMKDSFEKAPLYKATNGRFHSNLGMVKQSVKLIYQLRCEYLADLGLGPFAKIADVVLYNFWGDDIAADPELLSDLISPSETDLQKTGRIQNNMLLTEKIAPYICKACGPFSDRESAADDFKETITGLFRDYIKRVNKAVAFDPSILVFVTEYWKDTTKVIIGNEIYFKIISLSFENLDKPFFKRKSKYKLEKTATYLEGLYALADRYLAYACDFYENEYLSKYLNNAWSKELKKYNLNYRKLYSAMSGDYFTGVSYEQFKYCFESADMSLLQSKCASGKYGGIRYMIVKLRSVLPIWYERVAETITDSKGKKYDKISLQRSVADDKVYAKEFRNMIRNIDIDFPK
jgi:hypothetical protein